MGFTLVLVAVFVAGLVLGYTGFAFNLFLVPVLMLVLPVKTSVVLGLYLAMVVNVILAVRTWRTIPFRVVAWLFASSIPGAALGVYLLDWAPARTLRIMVGCLTVLAAILLWRKWFPDLSGGSQVLQGSTLGFLSGSLLSSTGMGGPPVVFYFMARGLDAVEMRSGMFAYTSGAIAVSVAFVQLRGVGAIHYEVASVGVLFLAAMAGVLAGGRLFARWSRFHRISVIFILLTIGVNGALSVFGV